MSRFLLGIRSYAFSRAFGQLEPTLSSSRKPPEPHISSVAIEQTIAFIIVFLT